jgi:hypothetical protein
MHLHPHAHVSARARDLFPARRDPNKAQKSNANCSWLRLLIACIHALHSSEHRCDVLRMQQIGESLPLNVLPRCMAPEAHGTLTHSGHDHQGSRPRRRLGGLFNAASRARHLDAEHGTRAEKRVPIDGRRIGWAGLPGNVGRRVCPMVPLPRLLDKRHVSQGVAQDCYGAPPVATEGSAPWHGAKMA